MKILLTSLFLALSCTTLFSQGLMSDKDKFTQQDTLRGTITPERAWWDLNFYHLDIEVKPDEKFITGSNTIRYKVLEENQVLQVDLQPPLKIEKVTQDGEQLEVNSNTNAHYITLKKPQIKDEFNEIIVHYSGKPKEAIRAPWDGGFSWKKDKNGKDFIATSCQGLGASVWWPNKDHMYDEVDSMAISVKVPKGLMNISNGRLKSIDEGESTTTYNWFVANPINNYGVNVNIGDYVHFGEKYDGEKGVLDMDYYVLKDNLETAKTHFKDAARLMEAFEHWFGPYPFYEDSYKLVEVPYLGMEHQSSVTYGNKYMKGYLGRDLSGTGWGLKFDYILIHESGHEWFANNITYKDIADMWIHESFTTYSENLFVDYFYGKEASSEYVIGTRKSIINDKPIIGNYNVNNEGSRDMYFKGANIIHTIRQLVNDDEKWRQILRGLNEQFYHKTVTTNEIENYVSKESGIDLKPFFNQYLRSIKIPILEYRTEGKTLIYRYTNIVDGFNMPVRLFLNENPVWISPTAEWKKEKIKGLNSNIIIDKNFYIDTKKTE
ncbi:M1 family metallopeptidase [Cellulophaga sp. HaHaR_3_176]|uniref:M1 family metallopeptidase n=1 Tax=Cellulophaga sp. HaHaR_3_176 TaxID=1942464 RepID=UPI001C1F45D8|nr:M1 family metallopeptidase [Cellulophaga sp. HaHaR_3_176]QWX85536.1 M1 family metallopeptidase [Cellulophaga sp. HaHaR_3_176]